MYRYLHVLYIVLTILSPLPSQIMAGPADLILGNSQTNIIGDGNDLLAAIMEKNMIKAQSMISEEKGINSHFEKGLTPLMVSILTQQPSLVKALLEHGADPHAVDKNGISAIFFAVDEGSIEGVNELLKQGVKIDMKGISGITPLMLALTKKNKDMAIFLLDKGADIRTRDRNGSTPLTYAKHFGLKIIQRRMEKMLLQQKNEQP